MQTAMLDADGESNKGGSALFIVTNVEKGMNKKKKFTAQEIYLIHFNYIFFKNR